ncbi:MAG: hypothetical protein A2075_02480 [Geobacteraceae bacterium GWC2_58_44]|nr:MAG: hypothetical protein A2075_02480 [Geobacteraceae bacterium GWC2_58_44]HBG06144.1 hypothetical protein [Geobacter sp.]
MENNKMSNGMRKGMNYFGSALKVTLGAGVALGGAYLLSRVGEKQETESSLSRLEQMLSELAATEEPEKVVGKRKK